MTKDLAYGMYDTAQSQSEKDENREEQKISAGKFCVNREDKNTFDRMTKAS